MKQAALFVNHVGVTVPDIFKAIEWYGGVFGLTNILTRAYFPSTTRRLRRQERCSDTVYRLSRTALPLVFSVVAGEPTHRIATNTETMMSAAGTSLEDL